MTIYEGVAALRQGKKIRRKTWPQTSYLHIKKDMFNIFDSIIIHAANEPEREYFPLLMDFDGDIWELYEGK